MWKNKRSGFSLIELMVGVFILSISLVFVIGLYGRLVKSSETSENITVGTSAGMKIMEDFLSENEGKPLKDGSVFGNMNMNSVQYFYIIDVSSPISQTLEPVKKIDVTVFWWYEKTFDKNKKQNEKFKNIEKVYLEKADLTTDGLYNAFMKDKNYLNASTKLSKIIFYPEEEKI